MHNSQEIELKVRINDPAQLILKLSELGAKFISEVEQIDRLYESPHIDFRADNQALRLRTETDRSNSRSILTYKGAPHHTEDGHKIRDEFETVVESPEQMNLLLGAISFENKNTIIKTRASYELDDVDIAIDTLKFGTFLELEGAPASIEHLRKKLGLGGAEPVREGYIFLQWDWESTHPEK